MTDDPRPFFLINLLKGPQAHYPDEELFTMFTYSQIKFLSLHGPYLKSTRGPFGLQSIKKWMPEFLFPFLKLSKFDTLFSRKTGLLGLHPGSTYEIDIKI